MLLIAQSLAVGIDPRLSTLSKPMVNPPVNGSYADHGVDSAFTKAQVEAIGLYVGIAAMIAIVIFFLVYCNRRRRKAKLHDTSSFDERDLASDSA